MLLVESAPIHFRGGNSRHTRNMRTMHDGPLDVLTGAYPEEEYWEDLLKVTGGHTDEKLARMTIAQTAKHVPWMKRHGVRFQAPLGGTLQLSRTNAFFLGGGKALVNAYYAAAQALGVDVAYDTEVVDLDIRDGRFVSATVMHGDIRYTIRAEAMVAASGGFESNLDVAARGMGSGGRQFHRSRHAVQQGPRAQAAARARARSRSAIPRRATASRSMRARRSSTAGS